MIPEPRIPSAIEKEWRVSGFLTDEVIGFILEDRAKKMPDSTAVITSDGRWSFAQLQEEAVAVANTLVQNGVGCGDIVSWMLPTGPKAISVASAIWRIGAVSSPIVPIYGVKEVASVLKTVKPKAIITDAEIRGKNNISKIENAFKLSSVNPAVKLLSTGTSPGWISATAGGSSPLGSDIQPAQAHEPALILFTSGTEAEPKGAVHTVHGLVHELHSTITEWGITFRDRMFMASPITHITGLLQGFLIPARIGASSILMDRWNPYEAKDLIEKEGATYMAGATPFLRELLEVYSKTGEQSSYLKQYCCGGAAVPPALIKEAEQIGIKAYRAWGMTELPTATLPNENDPLWARAETDGPLAPGVELKVLDHSGQELPIGESGILFLRGPEMMRGYLQEEANSRAFTTDGWFDTGDIGWIGEDGYVRIVGRSKDIINRGGEKFSALEIESYISQHPDVTQASVIAVPGGRLGERIGAAIISVNKDLTLESLADFLKTLEISPQKFPELLCHVNELPTNATGKINRLALLELFED